MIRVTRSAIIDAPIGDVWAVLRDFNSHWAWHPAVGESHIEHDEPADQVGCIRNFFLKDGHHIREQLLALSDRDHLSTYCILDATLPMRRYVATLQLKPVTDGARTFWHWQSTFEVPKGREREFDQLVGGGVYEGGFEGLRAYLRARGRSGQPVEVGAAPRRGTAATATAASAARAAQANSGATDTTLGAAIGGSMPAASIVVERHGGPEVLRLQSTTAAAPGAGQVRLRQRAIGLNYIDVYNRKGLYRMLKPPGIPGMEAAGEVIDVGEGVSHLLPGDRVAYASPASGAYTTVRTLEAGPVVVLPDDLDYETAAALMFKGMTAQYLLHRTHSVRAGERVLVHAAAGGVGLLLCQWARALGAQVIGTVSTEHKARLAREHGCSAVIVTDRHRFADQVLDLTDGRGADVCYDGLGRDAMEENLRALAACGHWVSYGQASGGMESIALSVLSEKSLTLSRPVLFHYIADRASLQHTAQRTFDAWRQGILAPLIGHRFALAAAADAHRLVESRGSHGAIVLLP